MATPAFLPAKSARHGRPPLGLARHSLDAEQAATRMFDPARRWGRRWCEFFRIPDEDRARYFLCQRVAALLHDLGKANADFVAAVGGGGSLQTVRHEHFSALILHLPSIRSWLASSGVLDVEAITAAVLSHHLKAARGGDWKWCQPRGRSSVRLHLGHGDIARTLERVAVVAGLGSAPTLSDATWEAESPWTEAWADGLRVASRYASDTRSSGRRRRFGLAVKAGLIVADAVASGLVREDHPIEQWIEAVVHAPALGVEDVRDAILQPRVSELERRSARPFAWHRFQEGAAQLGPRALLLASCGAGKTLAAWRWAEQQIRTRPLGRVVFLYPTRGTATEGFRDYVGWAPEAESALVHGTSRYELDGMAENPSEAVAGKNLAPSETEARLFALGLWGRRYFSATVDQFLAFLEHSYQSVCLLPVLADAAVVIDEVHSFDRRMFDGLVGFLRAFDVPVLCMTATLPPSRRRELENAGLTIYPSAADRSELADLEAQESHPRYQVEQLAEENDALERAVAASRRGSRVLWVVNVVSRAQRLARRLEELLGFEVLCYHSRFRLRDRRWVHDQTVQAFKDAGTARVAVTTQVCEMSLDLDADVLVTEVAPIAALVQRMGRANRHGRRGDAYQAPVLIYPPESGRPYEQGEIVAAETLLSTLCGRPLSQRDLAEAMALHVPAERAADGSARFLEGGYFATVGSFRDIGEHGRPALLDIDLDAARGAMRQAPSALQAFLVTVPVRALAADVPRPGWLPSYVGIARGAAYDERFGFDMAEGGK